MRPCQCGAPKCTALEDGNHGTSYVYLKKNCRCERCRAAKSHIAKKHSDVKAERRIILNEFARSEEWKEDAVCKGMDTNIFFPDETQKTNNVASKLRNKAIAICSRCPVRIPCRAYAAYHRDLGVWGGTTFTQRREMRAGRLGIRDRDIDLQSET